MGAFFPEGGGFKVGEKEKNARRGRKGLTFGDGAPGRSSLKRRVVGGGLGISKESEIKLGLGGGKVKLGVSEPFPGRGYGSQGGQCRCRVKKTDEGGGEMQKEK